MSKDRNKRQTSEFDRQAEIGRGGSMNRSSDVNGKQHFLRNMCDYRKCFGQNNTEKDISRSVEFSKQPIIRRLRCIFSVSIFQHSALFD